MAQARSVDLVRAADVLCHEMKASELICFKPPSARDDYGNVNPQERFVRAFLEVHSRLSNEARTLLRYNTTMRRSVLVEHIEEVAKSETPEQLTDRAWALVRVCNELGWCPVLTNLVDAIEPDEFIQAYNYMARPKDNDLERRWLESVCDAIRDAIDEMPPFQGSSVLYVSDAHMYEDGELEAIDDEMPDLGDDEDASKYRALK
jgi:hypothetical protein